MQRVIVQVVRMRLGDLQPGDIVNKNPDDMKGWFPVHEMQELPNDGVAALGSTSRDGINGSPNDIVGVQIRQVVEIPDYGPSQPAAPARAPIPEERPPQAA